MASRREHARLVAVGSLPESDRKAWARRCWTSQGRGVGEWVEECMGRGEGPRWEVARGDSPAASLPSPSAVTVRFAARIVIATGGTR